MMQRQPTRASEILRLPLRIRGGSFVLGERSDSLLQFATAFFNEYRGSVPDDPGFGGQGVPWGRRGALMVPFERVLAEFRNRYGNTFSVSVCPEEVVGRDGGTRRVRLVHVSVRSDRNAQRDVEV